MQKHKLYYSLIVKHMYFKELMEKTGLLDVYHTTAV
jgi:hypothetical protein